MEVLYRSKADPWRLGEVTLSIFILGFGGSVSCLGQNRFPRGLFGTFDLSPRITLSSILWGQLQLSRIVDNPKEGIPDLSSVGKIFRMIE